MFEIKTLKDGLKKIAPRTKTKAITDDNNKNLDTILSEKANSTDVPSKVSQLTNDTGFITNDALDNYPNNTQMNAAITSHHDSTKQDKLAAQTPYTNVGSKNKIPKITTNALGQVTNVEEVDVEVQQANLSQNLTYANDNNTSIVTNVSDDLLLNDSATYIEARKNISVIDNGLLSSVEKAIARFSKDYFSIKNTNEITINNDKVLAVDGSSTLNTYSPIINNLNTGIACSFRSENLPIEKTDTLILCGGVKERPHLQVAFTANDIFFRTSPNGVTWNNWRKYYLYKQDKLTFSEIDFDVTNNNVSLNPTKLADYLLKSDAPGYADILTKTLASTTYVAKNDAPGYDDILTNANASATYETKTNASKTYETKANANTTYVSKNDAVGYDDILTNANANTTYETKDNASATYVSKTDAVGYDDILTNANASNTYVTKSSLINTIYPVGSIYVSINNVNPGTLFGGTWVLIQNYLPTKNVCGNGKTLGVTDGTNLSGIYNNADYTWLPTGKYVGQNVGAKVDGGSGTFLKDHYLVGVATPTLLGNELNNSGLENVTITVYIWERTN